MTRLKNDLRPIRVSTFETPLGWFGILGDDQDRLIGVKMGYATEAESRKAVALFLDDSSELIAGRWHGELEQRLVEFAHGEPVDFSDVELAYPGPLTRFQTKVIKATRRIPFGETRSYAQVAAQAGSPRAARAVGTCMKNNRFPIIVPCHRVVASGGGLGGFSAPRGVSLKRQLLAMESVRDADADRLKVSDHLA